MQCLLGSGGNSVSTRAVRSQIALILHAHLPFVRHPEHETFLEEAWLFEAIAQPAVKAQLTGYYKQVNDGNKAAFASRMPKPPAPGEPGYVSIDTCST